MWLNIKKISCKSEDEMEIIEEEYIQDKDNMSAFKFGSSLNIHSEVILKIIDIKKQEWIFNH